MESDGGRVDDVLNEVLFLRAAPSPPNEFERLSLVRGGFACTKVAAGDASGVVLFWLWFGTASESEIGLSATIIVVVSRAGLLNSVHPRTSETLRGSVGVVLGVGNRQERSAPQSRAVLTAFSHKGFFLPRRHERSANAPEAEEHKWIRVRQSFKVDPCHGVWLCCVVLKARAFE